MTAFETAMIAAVRAALKDDTADVYWRDGSSAYRSDVLSVALSYVSRSRRGQDARILTEADPGTVVETIRGNRVTILQAVVNCNASESAQDVADGITAGLVCQECEDLLAAVNTSAARPGPVRQINAGDRHGDTRSIAAFEIAVNQTRSHVARTSPGTIEHAEVTGTITDVGPVGPGMVPPEA